MKELNERIKKEFWLKISGHGHAWTKKVLSSQFCHRNSTPLPPPTYS